MRLLVRRPADPVDFNGVVVVEWLNVSAMAEGDADYQHLREELLRGGYAWVGVGAQSAGVNAPRTGLKAWDPVRYGPLSHPGDPFSFDIFAQAVRALRQPVDDGPLAGFGIRHVLATGRSQSAMRLITYINALHARDRLLDGYLVHSRGAAPAGLQADRLTGVADPLPAGARIRADIDVPVLDVQAEGDMVTLRSHLARQDPHDHLRHWEIAGRRTPRCRSGSSARRRRRPTGRAASPPAAAPRPSMRPRTTPWSRRRCAPSRAGCEDGVAPPQSPRIELGDPAADDPVLRDRFGNARGGIRLPQVEAPTATLDGRANAAAAGGSEGRRSQLLLPVRPHGAVRPGDPGVAVSDPRTVREPLQRRGRSAGGGRLSAAARGRRRPAGRAGVADRPLTATESAPSPQADAGGSGRSPV